MVVSESYEVWEKIPFLHHILLGCQNFQIRPLYLSVLKSISILKIFSAGENKTQMTQMRSWIQEQLKAGLYMYFLILFPLHTSHLSIPIHSLVFSLTSSKSFAPWVLNFLPVFLSRCHYSSLSPSAEERSLQQTGWKVHKDSDKSE